MNIISFNVHGLRGRAKLLSLKCLVDVMNPNILLLQETMAIGVEIVSRLEKLFPQFC